MRDLLADGARCRRSSLECAEAGSTAGSAARARSAASAACACSAASASCSPAAAAGGACCRRGAFGPHRRSARGPETCSVEGAAQARRSARGPKEGARGDTEGETGGGRSSGTDGREQERRFLGPGIRDVEGVAVPPRRAPRGSPAAGRGSYSGPRRPLARLACARRSSSGARAPRRLGAGGDRVLLPAGDDVHGVTR